MNEQHEALKKFSYQIEYALTNYKPHGLTTSQFNNIVIGGLGGSGIGGQIVKSLFATEMILPVECISDYHLPAYVNEKSLVILGSYSGNTEEILAMFEEVKERKSYLLILTAGGKLKELAIENKIHFYQIETGFQPRMALGFSLTYFIQIFAELIGTTKNNELKEAAQKVTEVTIYQAEATSIFESVKSKLKNKLVILTDGAFAPIGIRFCQQIQENAKHECFQHVLPEMNHNVIESYYGQLESVFLLIDSQQNERVSSRFEFLGNLLEVENNKVVTIPVDHFNIASVYEIIFMLDWLSLYIADYRRVDSLNVPNIMSLKEFLSQ